MNNNRTTRLLTMTLAATATLVAAGSPAHAASETDPDEPCLTAECARPYGPPGFPIEPELEYEDPVAHLTAATSMAAYAAAHRADPFYGPGS